MNNYKLKVGIFSPYIDMFGGGERYIISIVNALSQQNEVYLYSDQDIGKKAFERFNISLKGIHFLPIDILRKQNLLKRYNYLRQYDLFIYMTDGSLFFSGAKKNLVIIQSPLHIPNSNFLNNFKLTNWKIICYSQFMKDIIQHKFGNNIQISTLAPCIDIPSKAKILEKKENIILTVGRFFLYPHDKKHGVLINIFKKAYKEYFSGWKLIIAGGLTEKGGKDILAKLESETLGFPIEIKVNLPSASLDALYQKAKIYWHATGFGEDLVKYPGKAEHFGIAPLEAMANGAVPLVYNGGGLKDIISEGQGGYLWDTQEELIKKTHNLIKDENLLHKVAQAAQLKAEDYSCDKFYERLEKIILI